MLGKHRGRSGLALMLMVAQAFLFNAVFFTYGLVLTKFYHVADARVGVYILPLAPATSWGRCCSGQLFDTVGPQASMIAGTYAAVGRDAGRGRGAVRHGPAGGVDADRIAGSRSSSWRPRRPAART